MGSTFWSPQFKPPPRRPGCDHNSIESSEGHSVASEPPLLLLPTAPGVRLVHKRSCRRWLLHAGAGAWSEVLARPGGPQTV